MQDPEKLYAAKRDLDLAEGNFQALHSQLMEDLPAFWTMGSAFFKRCVWLL